jgi:hypothetical protein
MNDGRNFSVWQPESIVNNNIQKEAGITSNWNYRRYLQNNAKDIMKYNYFDYSSSTGNNPNTYQNTHTTGKSPYVFKSTHDKKNPTNENYSDLKQNYLSREQLNARLISPSIPTSPFS